MVVSLQYNPSMPYENNEIRTSMKYIIKSLTQRILELSIWFFNKRNSALRLRESHATEYNILHWDTRAKGLNNIKNMYFLQKYTSYKI